MFLLDRLINHVFVVCLQFKTSYTLNVQMNLCLNLLVDGKASKDTMPALWHQVASMLDFERDTGGCLGQWWPPRLQLAMLLELHLKRCRSILRQYCQESTTPIALEPRMHRDERILLHPLQRMS
jgi:hypothetical protein